MKYSKAWYLKAILALAFLATSGFFAAHQARAQSLIDAANPQEILNIAKGYGAAGLTTTNSGDPIIVGEIEGGEYGVVFYGCSNGGNCKNIQFVAFWVSDRVSLSDINRWNKTKRFGKAALDDNDDPFLQMDVNLDGGVSRENLDDAFDWWKLALVGFKNEFNLK